MMTESLPTGGCFFRLLDSGHACGCQRFSPRRRRKDSILDDDEHNECHCQHHACFHRTDTPSTPPPLLYRSGRSHSVQRGSLVDTFEHRVSGRARNSSVSSIKHEDGSLRRSIAAFSTASGNTTERDSKSVTPVGILPAFPRRPPLFSAPALNRAASRTPDLHTARQSRELSVVPITDSVASKTSDVRLQITRLADLTQTLKSHQMTQQDQLDLVEGLPSIIEELAEKIELLDHEIATIEARHVNFEDEIRAEINDRLGAIEAYIRLKEKKRGWKTDGKFEGLSSAQGGDSKRQRAIEQNDFGNSFVQTTTTSFTTTTSTSSSMAQYSQKMDDNFQLRIESEIDELTQRLADVEQSTGPSAKRPWEVEFVLIPPSPLIAGAWDDGTSSAASTQFESSEVRPPGSLAVPLKAPGGAHGRITGPAPRSFASTSKQYLRLQSRGFVKQLTIAGGTAKVVSNAIETEFGELLNWCASKSSTSQNSDSQGNSSNSSQQTIRAFEPSGSVSPSPWQPLRKIYQQTVLEYISGIELATPSLWTVEYLKGHCMQHSKARHVVYIMPTVMAPTMTWDDIRVLPVYIEPNSPSPSPDRKQLLSTTAAAGTRSQEEWIWEFDRRLDSKTPASLESHSSVQGGSVPASYPSLPFTNFNNFEPSSLFSRSPSPEHGTMAPKSPLIQSQSELQSLQLYRSTKNPAFQPDHDEHAAVGTPPETNPHLQSRGSARLNHRQRSQKDEQLSDNNSTLFPSDPESPPPKSKTSERRKRRPPQKTESLILDPPPPSPPVSEPSRRIQYIQLD
ncbi:hypothetical protein EX30DRAFT_261902 [Ascodesmis nigricans]|uniref:Uncharacterized protein n=1 Tax=Ascodesmis nigricans TaxID=341454 RepID=A0A4S2MXN1_9PEZI|nr:hypothetical protein EX30DRAFT_261902 [Ascodesmis nigricans]